MNTIIHHDEIVKAVFPQLKPGRKVRVSTVENKLNELGIPYMNGKGGVFTTMEAINARVCGINKPDGSNEIEFV